MVKKFVIAGLILASLIVPGQITALMTPDPCPVGPFTQPVSQGSLDAMIQNCLRWKKSQDVISRAPHGLLPDVMGFSVATIVRLADPINLIASAILIVGVCGLSRRWET